MPADVPPNFLAALVAWWLATPALVAAVRGPYFGQAGVDVEPPYCLLTVPTTRKVLEQTDGTRSVQSTYRFEVYAYDQAAAVEIGGLLTDLLDPLHERPNRPAFADGYLIAWQWTAEELGEVPEMRSGGAKTIWRQVHIYMASIVHPPKED